MPAVYATPGFDFLSRRDGPYQAAIQSEGEPPAPAPTPGAKINILNKTPFTMETHDAVIRDASHLVTVNGVTKVLAPGKRLLQQRSAACPPAARRPRPLVTIVQDAYSNSRYNTGSFLRSRRSIRICTSQATSSMKAATVNITNNKRQHHSLRDDPGRGMCRGGSRHADFNLNSDDWFHTNRDPRQYLDFLAVDAAIKNTATTLSLLSTGLTQTATDLSTVSDWHDESARCDQRQQ